MGALRAIIEGIIADQPNAVKKAFDDAISSVIGCMMEEKRNDISNDLFERHYMPTVRRVGRLNFVRIRVRHGKIQRRKKVSAVKGWTYRHGHMVRMRPAERLHRRMAARRAKIKRRAKKSQIRRHMMIAMRKRRSLGLSYRPFGR